MALVDLTMQASPEFFLKPKQRYGRISFTNKPYTDKVKEIAGPLAEYTVYQTMTDAKQYHGNRTGLVIVTDGVNKGIYRSDFSFITSW